jgi:hypothetical protein
MSDDEGENWANMANPPEMIMKLMLLQKKEGFINAFMAIKKHNANGANVDASRTLVWLSGLWLECSAILQRDNNNLYTKVGEALVSVSVDEHVDAFLDLMTWLDKKGLKWDVRGGYDKSNIRQVSKALDNKMS